MLIKLNQLSEKAATQVHNKMRATPWRMEGNTITCKQLPFS